MICSKRIGFKILVYSHLFKKMGIINEEEFQRIMEMYPDESAQKNV